MFPDLVKYLHKCPTLVSKFQYSRVLLLVFDVLSWLGMSLHTVVCLGSHYYWLHCYVFKPEMLFLTEDTMPILLFDLNWINCVAWLQLDLKGLVVSVEILLTLGKHKFLLKQPGLYFVFSITQNICITSISLAVNSIAFMYVA